MSVQGEAMRRKPLTPWQVAAMLGAATELAKDVKEGKINSETLVAFLLEAGKQIKRS